MQAFRIHEFGHSDVLQLEQMPKPGTAVGEIVAAVRAVGVNPVDWKIREGQWKDRVRLPLTAGQDFAGEVDAAEADAKWKPGDQVFGFAHGSYAEYALAAADAIAAIPGGMSFETAAALPTPGLTAWQMIIRAGLREDQRVLIHGAAGSVGELAVQLAVRARARDRDSAQRGRRQPCRRAGRRQSGEHRPAEPG